LLLIADVSAHLWPGPRLNTPRWTSFLYALEAGSRTLGLTPINVSVHGIADVEKALAATADTSGTGLVVMSDASLFPRRKEIAGLSFIPSGELIQVYSTRPSAQTAGSGRRSPSTVGINSDTVG
jgi:hypothetical protein